jgi:hypothetical protein
MKTILRVTLIASITIGIFILSGLISIALLYAALCLWNYIVPAHKIYLTFSQYLAAFLLVCILRMFFYRRK